MVVIVNKKIQQIQQKSKIFVLLEKKSTYIYFVLFYFNNHCYEYVIIVEIYRSEGIDLRL